MIKQAIVRILHTMIKQLLGLGLPISFIRFIQVGGAFIGMFFLAHLGHQYVAAGALIASIRTTIIVVSMSILFAVGVVSSRLAGANKHHEMGTLLQHAWLIGLLLSIPAMLLCGWMGSLLTVFNQPPAVIPIVHHFFHLFLWSVPAIMLSVPAQQFMFALRKQKLVMSISCTAVVLFVIACYVFILGHWGAPKMGAVGLAIAYIIQCCFALLSYLCVFLFMREFKTFSVFKLRLHKDWQPLKTLWQVGWPMSIQFGGELVSLSVISIIVGLIGVNALAALQVVNQYVFLIVVPIFGLAEATSILVGHAKGSDATHQIRHIGHASLWISTIFSLLVGCAFVFIPHSLSRVFIHGHGVAAMHTLVLLKIIFAILVVTMLFDNARTMLTANLRGLYDTKVPMYISLGMVWILGIPLGILLAFPFHLGLIGIEAASAFSTVIGAVLVFWRWCKLTACS